MRNLMIAALFLLTAGCEQQYVQPVPHDLGFTRYQPVFLDVASIEIIDAYKSPLSPPYVEQEMPYSPMEAMHIWVRDRLRATGGNKTMQVIIQDASVTETVLPKPDGLTGLFTVAQDKRYDAKLSIEMRIYSGRAMSEASIVASATRSMTTREDASVVTREAVFRRMIFDLMESLNAELEKNMFMYFGNFIVYSHTP